MILRILLFTLMVTSLMLFSSLLMSLIFVGAFKLATIFGIILLILGLLSGTIIEASYTGFEGEE